jgi:hypothetical protein
MVHFGILSSSKRKFNIFEQERKMKISATINETTYIENRLRNSKKPKPKCRYFRMREEDSSKYQSSSSIEKIRNQPMPTISDIRVKTMRESAPDFRYLHPSLNFQEHHLRQVSSIRVNRGKSLV